MTRTLLLALLLAALLVSAKTVQASIFAPAGAGINDDLPPLLLYYYLPALYKAHTVIDIPPCSVNDGDPMQIVCN